VTIAEAAYIAGLFDGEGCVQYKQYIETKKKHKGPGTRKTKVWRITMEMAMADESTIRWVHEVLGVGTVKILDKTKPPHGKPYYKRQWRWRCTHRDAYYVCKLLWPYAQTKLHKIEQIIDHYEPEFSNKNVVNLEKYR
jgi:hypothetical protein|tara:strand:- start:170 stop:583 length:414 start_codon:yes stop_codon:yes gene_type:complete